MNLEVDPHRNPKLAIWRGSPRYATWLSSVLNTAEGALLIDVLNEQALPHDFLPEEQVGDQSYLNRTALTHAYDAGIHATTRALRRLSTIPEENAVPDSPPWAEDPNPQPPE